MATADVSALQRAFDAARSTGDFTSALNELRESWPQMVSTAGASLRGMLDCTPDELWHNDPWLVTGYATSFRSVDSTSRTTALPYFEAAFALLTPETPAFVRATLFVRYAAALRSLGRLNDALAAIASASAIADSRDVIPLARRVPLTAEIALHRGAIAFHGGDFDRAKADFRLAGSLAETNLSLANQLEVFGCLALIQLLMGDFEHALSYIARAESAGASPSLRNSKFNAPALISELLIGVMQNGTDSSGPLVARVHEATQESDWEPLGLYAEAFTELFVGNAHEGLEKLRQALLSLDEWQPAGFADSAIRGLRAAALLQLGDSGSAWELLANLAPTQHHVVCPNRLIAHLRFVTGDARGALDALRECESLGDNHSSRTLTDVFLVKAAAHLTLGGEEQSSVAFDRALRLAARNRMHSPFRLIPSEVVQEMLTRAATRSQPLEVGALIKRLDGLTVILAPRDSLALSDRERSIARELVRGSSSSEIAETLFISVNTVKSHLKSIYRKLGVTSRVEAIHKSRELGLQVDITRD
ncbi:helix-turn-helix transcriptional regulator [Salinibacterium sp. NK8237]|uniref:helix-turn-helix transcriptional regulator n=1 Tax=Salinibacterium sp. NK8237 TaxID=2792038 RepID=UPI0018CE28DD|nr:helix-turn-helix transcriptional regulator [Salinibacterium sp. NK8237]MBH0130957.1 response regulator transcription factor [Salinibacterium sp. NK8237]